ncbi:importin subunit beta-1-like [Halichondria panicea]|uniref:importin subunit beta-1-like n=1 Tax=Halichondria panicea TaxID=6063 RepID=UPI00312BAE26
MDVDQVCQVLEATISPDTAQIQLAQHQLEQAAAANLPAFLLALATVLGDVAKSSTARMAAGLQLKNYLTSKTPEIKLQYQLRWLSIDMAVREQIKSIILSTLGTEASHRSASQCVAFIAAAELPQAQWPGLIQALLVNMTTNPTTSNTKVTENLKEASLEAIGYICEELEPRFLAAQSNEILTAIVRGMSKDEPTQSNTVKLAATKALLNSLEFTKANFEKETERHIIMQVVCEATQVPHVPVQVAALQNLVRIMGLYYPLMEAYMGPALFAITLEAMKSNVDEIALQGIEFWSTVCDEEVDLAIEAAEAKEQGRPPEQVSKFYVKGAQQYLIPVLLLSLTKQEEFDDEDDWNPCKAAGVCLTLMASCCEDDIVAFVIPFIQENIVSNDWKFRDAAIVAMGSVLEGPSPTALEPAIANIVERLIGCIGDEAVQVRDSAAWTIGRICEHVPSVLLTDITLPPLLQALGVGLEGEPRVATNVCWAFSSLAEAAYDQACDDTSEEEEPATFCLSTSFEHIATKLLACSQRADGGTGNLRSAAYEALMDLIKFSAKDCYPVVQNTTAIILESIKHVLNIQVSQLSGADRQQLTDMESLLCATLQSLLRKVNTEDIQQISDTVMQSLLVMFQSHSGQSGGGVQEDAIMTVGVLVEVIGEGFGRYMEAFKPFLLHSLRNYAEHQVCLASVGLVGDLCRSLGQGIAGYCPEFMAILLETLGNSTVHRSLKPQILSTIGDIALALGPNFQQYLEVVLQILQQAASIESDKTDFDMIDYVNELREGCLEAYTGIVQGLKGDNKDQVNSAVQLISNHVPSIIAFIERVADDEEHTDANVATCCGLLGDLVTAFGVALGPLLNNKGLLTKLVAEGRRSRMKRTKTLAAWATQELSKLSS